MADNDDLVSHPVPRRTALKALVGMGLALPFVDSTRVRQAIRPQENDLFVFAFGDRQGQFIAPEDVPLGGPQIFAYPMDPETKQVRSESRLNQIILVRIDPEDLTDETRARSADGIVAYSAVCTHTGCDVIGWQDETKSFKCPCHDSEFDPSDGARVLSGPAPRRLAALPLKLVDGVLMAAGTFSGRVGFQPP